MTSIPIDLAEPQIIFVASLISNAFKSFIFSLAIASACFIVIDPAIILPGSFDPLFNLAASLIKCDAGGDFIIKSPPASHFIREAAKLKSGSQEPGRVIVGSITKKQAQEIAKEKMKDLNAHDLEEATKIICGSARSMGIEVK